MRTGRVVGVTAGLAGAGALVGAAVAVLMAIILMLPEGLPHPWRDRMFFLFVGSFGAAAVYLRNETPREARRIDVPADPALLPEIP